MHLSYITRQLSTPFLSLIIFTPFKTSLNINNNNEISIGNIKVHIDITTSSLARLSSV